MWCFSDGTLKYLKAIVSSCFGATRAKADPYTGALPVFKLVLSLELFARETGAIAGRTTVWEGCLF